MYNLERFKKAQKDCFYSALEEIKNGRKESHWMWFIFPQIKGLGYSPMAEYYGVESLDEAKAYLNDEYLNNNLRTISKALLDLNNNDISYILGYPDDLKLKSSMTLFYLASNDKLFKDVLDKYYNGELDNNTIELTR